jgi:hypothetical protein
MVHTCPAAPSNPRVGLPREFQWVDRAGFTTIFRPAICSGRRWVRGKGIAGDPPADPVPEWQVIVPPAGDARARERAFGPRAEPV